MEKLACRGNSFKNLTREKPKEGDLGLQQRGGERCRGPIVFPFTISDGGKRVKKSPIVNRRESLGGGAKREVRGGGDSVRKGNCASGDTKIRNP